MVFGITQGAEGYKDLANPKYSGDLSVKKPVTVFEVTDVPAGEYVVVVYQDKDKNGELNKSLFGPSEPYGFSRNPKIRFGPPKYEATMFKVGDSKPVTLDIKLK